MEPISGVARDDLLDRERQNKQRCAAGSRSRDDLDQEKQKIERETRELYEAGLAASSKIEARVQESRKLKPASSCAVCHDDFKKGDTLRTMPCAHNFHERCIFRSLRVHHLCLVCDYEPPTSEEAVVLEACARAGSELFWFIKIAGSQISDSFVT